MKTTKQVNFPMERALVRRIKSYLKKSGVKFHAFLNQAAEEKLNGIEGK